MYNIPKNLTLDNISAKEKFQACHRNRGLPVYTFYAYWATFQRQKPSKD